MKWAADIKQTALIFHIVKNNIAVHIKYHPAHSHLVSLSGYETR